MEHSDSDTIATLINRRIIAVIRERDSTHVASICDELIASGITVLEFTLTTPNAMDHVTHYAADSNLCVGVGSVFRHEDVVTALDAGAQFAASPVSDAALCRFAADLDIPLIPGAYTPTEIWDADRNGAGLVKLFPLPANGPAYIRSILGPMPGVRLAPSGGITADNAGDLLQAGASVLNIGSWLSPRGGDGVPDRAEISRRVTALMDSVETFTLSP